MSQDENKSSTATFLDEHGELRDHMSKSENFDEMKKRKGLSIDGEQIYIVQGDVQGDEDDLYLDSIIRGANPNTDDQLARRLFLELDEPHKQLIMKRFMKN
jgi:hypothetical protein